MTLSYPRPSSRLATRPSSRRCLRLCTATAAALLVAMSVTAAGCPGPGAGDDGPPLERADQDAAQPIGAAGEPGDRTTTSSSPIVDNVKDTARGTYENLSEGSIWTDLKGTVTGTIDHLGSGNPLEEAKDAASGTAEHLGSDGSGD